MLRVFASGDQCLENMIYGKERRVLDKFFIVFKCIFHPSMLNTQCSLHFQFLSLLQL